MTHTTHRVANIRKVWFLALWTSLVLTACSIGADNAERLARGQDAYVRGEYRAAIIDAKNVLQNEPDSVDARLLLGRSSLRIGDPRAAEKELRRAIELGADRRQVVVDLGRTLLALREFEQIDREITPEIGADEDSRIAILRIRGEAMLAQQRVAEARAIFVEILSVRDDDLDTMLAVVTTYVAENELLQAQTTLEQILSIDPDYIAGWMASGSLAALQQDLERAELNFAKGAEIAVQKNDMAGQIRGLTGVVEAQLAQGKAEDARLNTAKLVELAPQNPFNEYLGARVSYLEKNWAAADLELRKMLERFPEYVPARVLMGAVQLRRGNLGLADVYLSAAVSLVPDNLFARKLLAEVRLQQNRAAKAAQVLQPILSGGSVDAGTLALAVRASAGAGDFDEAIRYLRIRAESQPDNVTLKMDLAATQMALGQIEEAQKLLQDLPVISEDDDYRREFLLVLASVREENFEEALVAARAMQGRWADDARLQNMLGGILDASGDRVAARQSFNTAHELDPSDIVSLIYLARLDINEGDFDSAYRFYEQALEIQPQNVGLLVSLGRVAGFKGDSDAAIGWMEKAREEDETNVFSRQTLGQLYLAKRDFVAAEQVAREAVAINSDIAESHNTLALAVSASGQHDSAVRRFKTAIELDPNEPRYSINLAREYVIGAEEHRARELLLGSLQSQPGHFQTAMILAGLHVQAGDVTQAIRTARALQQQSPDSAGPTVLLAELYYADEQFDLGADLYDKAMSLSGHRDLAVRAYQLRVSSDQARPEAPLLKYIASRPEDPVVRMMLAREYQGQGKDGDAAAEYRKVLEAAPDNTLALNNLAWIYFTQGKAEAVTLARKASELAPQSGPIADTLGWILVQTGSVEEGVEYLRRATQLAKGSREFQYHLAVGLVETGATDEARNLLSQILSVEDSFPGRGEAEALLSKL